MLQADNTHRREVKSGPSSVYFSQLWSTQHHIKDHNNSRHVCQACQASFVVMPFRDSEMIPKHPHVMPY